ncbi:MAG: hypothetical protein Q7J04_04555, partial [Microcella sp.]|nr:hypothetical protein [Microcella sp.]
MTNWNVVVDDSIIVKVSRRLGDGDRAVRLVRAVAQHEPEAVPTLHATVELRGPGAPAVVATVTALMSDAVDGWTWAVDELDAH